NAGRSSGGLVSELCKPDNLPASPGNCSRRHERFTAEAGWPVMRETKAQLRTAALSRRDALGPEERAAAAQAIARRGLPVAIKSGAVVAGYSPIRNEVDPVPLMQTLAATGARLALPVVPARGKSLIFRAWSPNDRLMLGPLGI